MVAGPLAVALTHAAIPHAAQGGKGVAGAVLLGWAADSVPETCAGPACGARNAWPLHSAICMPHACSCAAAVYLCRVPPAALRPGLRPESAADALRGPAGARR